MGIMGNLYNETDYDTIIDGKCYRISLYDHGSNGAGLYVDDQYLIAEYNSKHADNLQTIQNIFNMVTQTFVQIP